MTPLKLGGLSLGRGRTRIERWFGLAAVPILLMTLVAIFPGERHTPGNQQPADPELFGIVGLDPWYTYNSAPERFPNDVNRDLLEHMLADMARLGARWIRIEFHAELGDGTGPGPIDYTKHDWFINELAPKYGIKVLAVLGSGLIGDENPAYGYEHINEPLGDNDSNPYIDLYIERVREITSRYGSRLGAVEILNEPNASEVLSLSTAGLQKSVLPANYGVLLRRSYDVVQQTSPDTEVVTGGVLYDTENETLPEGKERSYDLDWLEAVYGSKAVMSYQAEHGRFPFDAVAVHPYFLDPYEIIDYLDEVREMQTRFGDDRSTIWITEIGLAADPPDLTANSGAMLPSKEEREQADFLSAVYTTVRYRAPYVERIFWFKYEDFPINGGLNGWGLVRLKDSLTNYASHGTPWPRKFAFAVYQALARPGETPMASIDPPGDIGPDVRYFTSTGHSLRAPFLDYWKSHGGVLMLGLPITEAFEHQGRLVQYFERARLEHYPDQIGTDQEIQIGLLGRIVTHGQSFEPQPAGQGPDDGRRYFPETSQYLLGAFRLFWETHGGLTQFGMPISPEIEEDGVTVQYFERARFEYTPDADGSGYHVQLGKLGNEALEIPGWYR